MAAQLSILNSEDKIQSTISKYFLCYWARLPGAVSLKALEAAWNPEEKSHVCWMICMSLTRQNCATAPLASSGKTLEHWSVLLCPQYTADWAVSGFTINIGFKA